MHYEILTPLQFDMRYTHQQLSRICLNKINMRFIKDSLKQTHDSTIFMAQTYQGELNGFVLSRRMIDDSLYMDLVCAQSRMKDLIQYFVEFAKEQRFHRIDLSAVPHLVVYYWNIGFRFKCDPTISLEEFSKPFPQTQSQSFRNPQYKDLFIDLHHKGCFHSKNDQCTQNPDPSWALVKKCAVDGYEMSLFLPRRSPRLVNRRLVPDYSYRRRSRRE